ncbi:MAG: cyclic nucleotide-binding domain-containing protein [Oligoflexales bacterium]|nr:cyclic nucleotide-binding domain-containing protein [Oligoflexales bacterium]
MKKKKSASDKNSLEEQTLLAQLKKISLFSTFSNEELAIIRENAVTQTFSKGSFLAKEAQDADSFFCLLSGTLAINTFVANRGMVTLQSLLAGEIVGWSWLFPHKKWVFSVQALSDCEVLCIKADAIKKHMEMNSKFSADLLMAFSKILVERLKITRLQLLDMYAHEAEHLKGNI